MDNNGISEIINILINNFKEILKDIQKGAHEIHSKIKLYSLDDKRTKLVNEISSFFENIPIIMDDWNELVKYHRFSGL